MVAATVVMYLGEAHPRLIGREVTFAYGNSPPTFVATHDPPVQADVIIDAGTDRYITVELEEGWWSISVATELDCVIHLPGDPFSVGQLPTIITRNAGWVLVEDGLPRRLDFYCHAHNRPSPILLCDSEDVQSSNSSSSLSVSTISSMSSLSSMSSTLSEASSMSSGSSGLN